MARDVDLARLGVLIVAHLAGAIALRERFGIEGRCTPSLSVA